EHLGKHERLYMCRDARCAKHLGFPYTNGLLRHQRNSHGLHGGPKKLYCPHWTCERSERNPFARRDNLNTHLRRIHKGHGLRSHDAVTEDGIEPTTNASELKLNEETPQQRCRRSGPEDGCRNPPGEHINTQIMAVRAESSSIRTMFVSQSVEMESLKIQLSQIRTQ
ncbi:uncharacterized protein M437DRAFT_31789, partial [Aureobasidium melanogenum CBS 110374]